MKSSIYIENQYRLHCATTDRTDKLIVCAFRKHRKWRGQSIDAPECAYAMSCGKCPYVEMEKQEMKQETALFKSDDPEKIHKTPKDIMDIIERRIFFHNYEALSVPPETMTMLLARQAEILTGKFGWKPAHILESASNKTSMTFAPHEVKAALSAKRAYDKKEKPAATEPTSFLEGVEINTADALGRAISNQE